MSARREVETLDYVEFARRIIRAAGARVGDGDEFELAELVSLRDDLERAIENAVSGQRAYGRSWAYIGDALGIKRQSAQERYGRTSPESRLTIANGSAERAESAC
jgi:hypothetical protein